MDTMAYGHLGPWTLGPKTFWPIDTMAHVRLGPWTLGPMDLRAQNSIMLNLLIHALTWQEMTSYDFGP